MDTTIITLSSKGQFIVPKKIRESDNLDASDVFRLDRLAPGKYLLEKLRLPKFRKAKLCQDKDGLPVFIVPGGSPRITSEMIKNLASETI